jgi:hypothetical protein
MKILIVCIFIWIFLNLIRHTKNENEPFTNIFFNDEPSLFNTTTKDSNDVVRREMEKRYRSPKIILRNIKGKRKMMNTNPNYVYSPLTGSKIPVEKFTHNNMKPYFGGKLKQNMSTDIYESKLENFTGVSKNNFKKNEEKCFGDLHKNVNDYQPAYMTQYDRMEKPKVQNNVLPMKQVRVGPGFNSENKYDSSPSGGYQQTDLAYNANMYKSVDDLRVKSNPKVTYDGVIVEGHKEYTRGKFEPLNKNRVERVYNQSHENLLKTTGAYRKPAMKPCQEVKKTNRQETVQEYKGIPHDPTKSKYDASQVSGPVKKTILEEFGLRNLNVFEGKKSADDYGKKNIQVYQNERDITSTKTRNGNVTTLIKSLIAPIQDILKPTQKEYLVESKRDFGGNVNGPNKLTIYDPNGVARTTIKETTIHDNTTGNMKVNSSSIVYDPSEVAKTTVREALENYTNDINLKGSLKPRVHDPDDKTSTTIRETTENSERDGNVSFVQHSDGYRNAEFEAKNTNKEITSDLDYYGMPENENGDGYMSANFEAKSTYKELLADHEYTGNGKSDVLATESYESIYNAVINDVREGLLEGREPTNSSVKINTGKDNMNLTKEKNECMVKSTRNLNNHDKLLVQPPSKEFVNIKKFSNEYESNRLDDTLVSALKSNPYSQSLHSAV